MSAVHRYLVDPKADQLHCKRRGASKSVGKGEAEGAREAMMTCSFGRAGLRVSVRYVRSHSHRILHQQRIGQLRPRIFRVQRVTCSSSISLEIAATSSRSFSVGTPTRVWRGWRPKADLRGVRFSTRPGIKGTEAGCSRSRTRCRVVCVCFRRWGTNSTSTLWARCRDVGLGDGPAPSQASGRWSRTHALSSCSR